MIELTSCAHLKYSLPFLDLTALVVRPYYELEIVFYAVLSACNLYGSVNIAVLCLQMCYAHINLEF